MYWIHPVPAIIKKPCDYSCRCFVNIAMSSSLQLW